MQILGTFQFGADKEVTVEYEKPVVNTGERLNISVVDNNGEDVKDSYVVIKGDTLNVDGIISAHTGKDDNSVEIGFGSGNDKISPDWRSNQDSGKLTITVNAPQDGSYTDERKNPKPTILKN